MFIIVIVITYFVFDSIIVSGRNMRARQATQQRAEQRELSRYMKTMERVTKKQQQAELAQLELDQLQDQRAGLLSLYSHIEAEYNSGRTTDARRLTLERQMLNIDAKLAQLDLKRAKLYQSVA